MIGTQQVNRAATGGRSRSASPRLSMFGLAVISLLMLALAGCGSSQDKSRVKPVVITTTPAVTALARAIAGDKVFVTELNAKTALDSDGKPTPGASAALLQAGTILRAGGDTDRWIVAAADTEDRNVVDLSNKTPLTIGGSVDARWFESRLGLPAGIDAIRDELIKTYPVAKETFKANARDLRESDGAGGS